MHRTQEPLLKGPCSFTCESAPSSFVENTGQPLSWPPLLKFEHSGGEPERSASVTCHILVLLFHWALCMLFFLRSWWGRPHLGSPLTEWHVSTSFLEQKDIWDGSLAKLVPLLLWGAPREAQWSQRWRSSPYNLSQSFWNIFFFEKQILQGHRYRSSLPHIFCFCVFLSEYKVEGHFLSLGQKFPDAPVQFWSWSSLYYSI